LIPRLAVPTAARPYLPLASTAKRVYRAATSPEAKRAYRQAAEIIKKARKK
jgi:hypothetical protein